jgi:hypothetical protein
MNRPKIIVNYEEQDKLAKTYHIEYEKLKTYLYKVETNDTEVVIVLACIDDGTILQKWICNKKNDGFESRIIYKNESLERTNSNNCDTSKIKFKECNEISNENNIQCYLCTKNFDIEDII